MVAVLVACAMAPVTAGAQTTGDLPYLDAVDAWADGQELRRTLRDVIRQRIGLEVEL